MILDKMNEFTAGLDTAGSTTKTYGEWVADSTKVGQTGWTYTVPTEIGGEFVTIGHKTDQTTPTADVTLKGVLSADEKDVVFTHTITSTDAELKFSRTATESSGGVAYTDILDWGTDGNPMGTPNRSATPGSHEDDVGRLLSWFVWAVTAVAGTLTIEWESSDDPKFETGVVTLVSKTVGGSSVAKGAYLVNGEPLPKGLKRYQRLKVTSNAATPSGKIGAFVVDVQGC